MAEYVKAPHWFYRIKAIYKLLVCLGVAVLVFLLLLPVKMEGASRTMLGWDVFSLCMIVIYAAIFSAVCPKQLRVLASREDESRPVVFTIVVVAIIGSLGGVLLLLKNQGGWLLPKWLETIIYITGVTFSWLLLHMLFTSKYAHLYYANHPSQKGQIAKGLDIPGDEAPDYMDFAYFAFVIGMTFQVSDIEITSKRMRRLVLIHGLISFLFNTVIVALTINVVVDLQGK
ncbi:DUF1345 domain-containing protein [Flavitalea sp. BT771]|uniref:DUF1345 domain-containing protein n=1 Tax=Flavitalea sp. BT771 TaxID=3063329 RepID=UPI0026E1FDBB|nr:DUF1345 domain-containing protein [Flavitalea sp. BT771]MDO6434981.1 DUF1345 domain-containing protein [Flavitalea sp. BT771]MDV6223881.1 DUF1345 domain-containing protein [Flavitalea sp. BT771]